MTGGQTLHFQTTGLGERDVGATIFIVCPLVDIVVAQDNDGPRVESDMHGKIEPKLTAPGDAGTNNLLRALRDHDAEVLAEIATPWWGNFGDVLVQPGDTVQYVYFPCGPSLISYLVVLEDGSMVETALIGREGAAGGIVSQGRLPAYARAEVQFPGPFMRIELVKLEEAKLGSLSLRHLFARYADCLMAQIFQAVACNAVHNIEQRTAKWLISAMDRTGAPVIPLTQEQLAAMLGVGRSYISRVLGTFKQRGLIETRRRGLVVGNVDELRALACGCNDSVRQHFDDVLRGVYPAEGISPEEDHRQAPVSPVPALP